MERGGDNASGVKITLHYARRPNAEIQKGGELNVDIRFINLKSSLF